MRGLLYGLDFAHILPTERYSKQHLDLYEYLGGRWGMNGTLAELSWFFGIDSIEGKGNEVQHLYDSGDLEGIRNHCMGDIDSTEALFHKLFPGGRTVQRN